MWVVESELRVDEWHGSRPDLHKRLDCYRANLPASVGQPANQRLARIDQSPAAPARPSLACRTRSIEFALIARPISTAHQLCQFLRQPTLHLTLNRQRRLQAHRVFRVVEKIDQSPSCGARVVDRPKDVDALRATLRLLTFKRLIKLRSGFRQIVEAPGTGELRQNLQYARRCRGRAACTSAST